jgi:hypothetical protein
VSMDAQQQWDSQMICTPAFKLQEILKTQALILTHQWDPFRTTAITEQQEPAWKCTNNTIRVSASLSRDL